MVGRARKAKILAKNVTIANGAALGLIANRLSLPRRSRLVAVDVSKSDNESAPVFSAASFGIEANGVVLDSGWIRGGTNYAWADGLHWDGEYHVPDEDGWAVFTAVRNDSGAAQTVTIEALVEEEVGTE